MTKIIVILIVAAIVESIGVAFLSSGLKEIRGAQQITVRELSRVIVSGATNPRILIGVAFEAAFFGALLYLLSLRDVSFVWPLTSLGFIFTTLAAEFILHEKVSLARWGGVLLIAGGAALTSYSEAAKTTNASAPAAVSQR